MQGRLTNLTPHDISFYKDNKVLFTIPSSGSLRLVEQWGTESFDKDMRLPIVRAPEYIGVSDPSVLHKYKYIIVSMPVAQFIRDECLALHPGLHVFCPDTGPQGGVRNEKGRIVGTTRLVHYQ